MPLPAACSNLVGMCNKEISLVLDYEGHFENRSNSSDSMFFSVYLFLSLGVVPFFYSNGGFLVTGNEQYVHQGESMLEIGSRDIQSEKIQLKLWL